MTKFRLQGDKAGLETLAIIEGSVFDYNEALFDGDGNNDIMKAISDYKLYKKVYINYLNRFLGANFLARIMMPRQFINDFRKIKQRIIHLENYLIINVGQDEFIGFCKGFSLVYGDESNNKKLIFNELDKFYYYYHKWIDKSKDHLDPDQEVEEINLKIISIEKKLYGMEQSIVQKKSAGDINFGFRFEKIDKFPKIKLKSTKAANSKNSDVEKIKTLKARLESYNEELENLKDKRKEMLSLAQKIDTFGLNMNQRILMYVINNIPNLYFIINHNNKFVQDLNKKLGEDIVLSIVEKARNLNISTIRMLDDLARGTRGDGIASIDDIVDNYIV